MHVDVMHSFCDYEVQALLEFYNNIGYKQIITAPRIWKRYIDDVLSIIKKKAMATFHDDVKSIDLSQ